MSNVQSNSVVPTNAAPPAVAESSGAWGNEGISTSDVLIPQLMLAHGLSKIVQNGGAKIGDIFNSNTSEVLARLNEKKLCFVPISYHREWHVVEVTKQGERKPYERFLVDDKNENLEKEGVIEARDGRKIFVERKKSHNFFVLLPQFIEELPFLIKFKGSNQMTGRRLVTHLQTSQLKGKPAAALVWSIYTSMHSYNDRTYPIFNVEPGEETPKAVLDVAFKWYNQITKSKTVVVADDEEVAGD